MLFMVIERFRNNDMVPIYQRLRESGRSLPDTCFQRQARGTESLQTLCWREMDAGGEPLLVPAQYARENPEAFERPEAKSIPNEGAADLRLPFVSQKYRPETRTDEEVEAAKIQQGHISAVVHVEIQVDIIWQDQQSDLRHIIDLQAPAKRH
jgi:hypothetical protein